jgi:hypothetical protein
VYAEFVSTRALRDLTLDLVFNLLFFGQRHVPIWAQSSHEFLMIDIPVVVTIDYVSNSLHFQSACREF